MRGQEASQRPVDDDVGQSNDLEIRIASYEQQ